jgi:hypothetical protein
MARRRFVSLFSITFLLLGLASARAGGEPLRIALDAKDIPAPHVEWYGIYINGTKGGYLRQEFGRSGEGKDAVCFTDQTGMIQLVAMGKKVAMELSERMEFDAAPPFAFHGARNSMTQEGNAKVIELSRTASGLSAKVSAGGETRTLERPAPDFTLADALTIERWFQSPRAAGDKMSVRGFNVDKLESDPHTYTILSRKETLVSGVKTVWYEASGESELRGDEGVARVDSKGLVISIVLGGMFEGRRETEEQAKKIEYGADLFVFGMAKLDKPIGDAVKVTRLVLEVDGEGAAKLSNSPRQSVARDPKTGAVTLSLGAAAGDGEPATATDAEEALVETVNYPTKLPQVVALAAKAVGDAKTPREKVERLIPFVRDYIDDVLRPEAVSVPEIIASKRGDCSEHALLFVTLARAVGVPTREVGGLMYMGDDVRSFGGHAWDEVLLDGKWLPVDPTWGEVGVDATHVTLDREGKGRAKKDMISSLGRLTFRLQQVETTK